MGVPQLDFFTSNKPAIVKRYISDIKDKNSKLLQMTNVEIQTR